MKLSKLRIIVGWVFLIGHFSGIVILFLWGLLWSQKGFAAISDIVALLMPLTGVAAVSAFKSFWQKPNNSTRVSQSAAISTIAIPVILTSLTMCLILAHIMQIAESPETIKHGIALCELIFGGTMTFILDKLFQTKPPLRDSKKIKETSS
ncbi:hypothetical protein [Luteolibacter sp. LG18]|uniref:hypothetical protein n=1 Tax=Luteolibacter sp. LG18 TaxID=2819286 RepID=UPI0030C6708C